MEDRESGAVVHEPEIDDAEETSGGKKKPGEEEGDASGPAGSVESMLPSDEQLEYAMKRASLSPQAEQRALKPDASVASGKGTRRDSPPSHQSKAKKGMPVKGPQSMGLKVLHSKLISISVLTRSYSF